MLASNVFKYLTTREFANFLSPRVKKKKKKKIDGKCRDVKVKFFGMNRIRERLEETLAPVAFDVFMYHLSVPVRPRHCNIPKDTG